MSFFYKPYILKIIRRSLQNQSGAQAASKQNNLFFYRRNICKKRTFCCTSFSKMEDGLMTVEAAVVLPLFLMAVLSLLNVAHMLGQSYFIFTAMVRAAHPLAVYGSDDDFGDGRIFGELAWELNRSSVDFDEIQAGIAGINLYGTGYNRDSGEITLSAGCSLKHLFSLFHLKPILMKDRVYTRAYIGGKMYDSEGQIHDGDSGSTVYVAENGVVYHNDRQCAYIDISLNMAYSDTVDTLRNRQGARYYPCELCMEGMADGTIVYVTDSGNRYHSNVQCSGIKRTVYEMAGQGDCVLPACSKCGG